MKREHDDDCANRRGFECDCGADEVKFVEATPDMKAMQENIGRKVLAKHHYAFRSGETAEIIGWGSINNRLCYTIRFNDMQTDMIPADEKLMKAAGFEFITE